MHVNRPTHERHHESEERDGEHGQRQRLGALQNSQVVEERFE
jgi:hypothetical protein